MTNVRTYSKVTVSPASGMMQAQAIRQDVGPVARRSRHLGPGEPKERTLDLPHRGVSPTAENAEDIDPHLPFSYYGLDSRGVVGHAVTPKVASDHPTADAVATFVGATGAVDDTLSTLLLEIEDCSVRDPDPPPSR